MQLGGNLTTSGAAAGYSVQDSVSGREKQGYAQYKVIRRNGAVVAFEPGKIAVAVTKAFLAINGGQGAASARVRELVETLTEAVVSALMRRQPKLLSKHAWPGPVRVKPPRTSLWSSPTTNGLVKKTRKGP